MKLEKEKRGSTVSQLYARRSKLNVKLEKLQKEEIRVQEEVAKVKNQLEIIETKLSKETDREIVIVTHAYDRYRERVAPGTDEEIRAVLLTPEMEKMIRTLGNGTYPLKDTNIRVVSADYKIVTVYTE